ncbi:uncharacterized protein LOC132619968 [Lycium barbarum]|uniref:uncharacterized protein LOC132619968 n=1 Tax=Lycium barbarum TaxID=112863 RepID=UPI00293F2BD7|nr:uncharacterized protein LOC132619968 [Lycium barbarum]
MAEISLYQTKYFTNWIVGSYVDTPMDPTLKSSKDDLLLFENPERSKSFVRNLIYLTITRLNLTLALGFVSQYMQNPRQDHQEAFCSILRHPKKLQARKKGIHRIFFMRGCEYLDYRYQVWDHMKTLRKGKSIHELSDLKSKIVNKKTPVKQLRDLGFEDFEIVGLGFVIGCKTKAKAKNT